MGKVFFSLFVLIVLTYWAFPVIKLWWKRIRYGTKAKGRIVNFELGRDIDGCTIFHPLVEFTSSDGEEYTFLSEQGFYEKRPIPEDVIVTYFKGSEKQAEIHNYFSVWGTIFFLVVIYSMMIGLLIGVL